MSRTIIGEVFWEPDKTLPEGFTLNQTETLVYIILPEDIFWRRWYPRGTRCRFSALLAEHGLETAIVKVRKANLLVAHKETPQQVASTMTRSQFLNL